jgi:CheY-like chemotaxis protein
VKSATELTKNLLGFARGGKYEVKPTNLNKLISNEIKIFSQTRKDITVHGKYDKFLHMVDADQGQLRQVFLNLFINSWQAMPGGGNIYVNTSNAVLSENDISVYGVPSGRYVKISVTDTGTGMDKKTLDNIFTPFFSTKDIDEGTGLGLASVYGIVTNHGGIIKAYSEKGKGTTFDIFIPASKNGSNNLSHDERDDEDLIMGEGTILLVDDEKNILNLCEKMLKHLGYKTVKCQSGIKALEYYSQNFNEIILVILDMTMPEMSGGETFDKIKQINPEAVVLLSSGYAVDGEAQEILNRGCSGFIQKPFTISELSRKISDTLQELKN